MFQISIVIRAKNEGRFLNDTLNGLLRQKVDYPFEVLLIDSGSTDDTLAIAESYGTKIYSIDETSFSYGYALNFGIEKASGNIITCLSAHCIPLGESWLARLIKPICEGKAHATFGRQLPVKGINPFEEVSLHKHFPERNKEDSRVPFSNANCAFLKDMWFEMKFDEELPSWEDYLWYSLLKHKYSFQYCPDAAVYHTHPFSIKAVSERAYKDGRSFRMIRKKYGIDVLGEPGGIRRSKTGFLWNDLRRHIRLFAREGHVKYLLLAPVVRFSVYRAYWKGYKSIK
jgi:glycosyltransferase involved in cell wall biosynthesis